MNVDAIQNGIVIDHISAGKGMKLYDLLGLDHLDASIAIIKNDIAEVFVVTISAATESTITADTNIGMTISLFFCA